MRQLGSGLLLVGLAAVCGCQRTGDAGAVSLKDVKRDVKKALETGERYLDQNRAEAQRRIEERLREFDLDLNAWRRKLETAAPEQRPALEKQVTALEERRKEVGKQADELRNAGSDTWGELRARVDQSLSEVKKSIQQAAERSEP